MVEDSRIYVLLKIKDSDTREAALGALALAKSSVQIDPCDSAEAADVIITDVNDSVAKQPLPELINECKGKPVVVIIAKDQHPLTRRLFIEGAADVIALEPINDQLAFAVRHAHLARSQDSGRLNLLSTGLVYFRELSEMAGRGTDLTTFFDRIVEIVSQIMDVEIVSLMLLNQRFQTLWIASARGLEDEIVRTTSIKVGEGISGRVAKEGHPLLIQDVESEPDRKTLERASRYNTSSLLSVPIRVRDKVIGVINVNNKRSGYPFDASDLHIMVTLCNQAGLAIDNARLFADLQSKAESLEQAYNELKRLNKAKTDLIVNLSHEIKTPLTAIIGYMDLLMGGQIQDPQKVQETYRKIDTRGHDLNRMVERIITFFALQTKSVERVMEVVPLTRIVYDAVDRLRAMARDRNVELTVDGPSLSYDIYCDISHMQEVFINLLENAIQFNTDPGTVTISGQTVSLGFRAVEVLIKDSGCGVAKAIAGQIFDGFVQTENLMSNKPEGLGIGLAMSRAILEDHGGTIELTDNSKTGATFAVTLPLR